MLAEQGIFAVSLELGGAKKAERTFFIKKADDLRDLVISNNKWMSQIMLYLIQDFECVSEGSTIISDNPDDPNTVKALSAYIC